MLLLNTQALAQNANYWFWPSHFGELIHFSETGINYEQDLSWSQIGGYIFGSYNDSAGKLRIYANFKGIYNGEGNLLDNSIISRNLRISGDALVIKTTRKSEFMVIFNREFGHGSFRKKALSFSLVNIDSNKVLKKDIPIYPGYNGSSLIAFSHPSGNFTWLANADDKFIYIYKVLADTVVLHREYKYKRNSLYGFRPSELKFSNFGNFLGFTLPDSSVFHSELNYTVATLTKPHLFRFDKYNGAIIEEKRLDSFYINHSFEFSANEKYIYSTRHIKDDSSLLVQIKNPFLDSETERDIKPIANIRHLSAGLRQAPDGDVYLIGNRKLIRLENSLLDASRVYLNRNVVQGLLDNANLNPALSPNFVEDYITHTYVVSDTVCLGDSTSFQLHNFYGDSAFFAVDDTLLRIEDSLKWKYLFDKFGVHKTKIVAYYPAFIDTLNVPVYIDSLAELDLGKDTMLCQDESLVLNIDSLDHPSIIWSDSSKDYSKKISDNQQLWLASNTDFCSTKDTINISFIDCGIEIDSFCYGQSTILNVSEKELDSLLVNWGDGTQQSTTNSNILNKYADHGSFIIESTLHKNGLQKIFKDTIFITKLEDDFLPDSLKSCDPLVYSPSLSQTDYNLYWNTGAETVSIEFNQTGMYRLLIEKNGCYTSDKTYFTSENCSCDVYLPTAFSPNSDQTNELFHFSTECAISEAKMTIYSRWGEIIAKDVKSWDGKYQGKNCAPGIYAYTFFYKDKYNFKHFKKGFLYLLN